MSETKKRISISMDKELHEKIQRIAENQKRSFSQMVCILMEEKVEESK